MKATIVCMWVTIGCLMALATMNRLGDDDIMNRVQTLEALVFRNANNVWGQSSGTEISGEAIDSDALEAATDPIEQALVTIDMSHMMSRTVLNDLRCYVYTDDGSYECWLPGGVCEFKLPRLASDAEAKVEATCHGYAGLRASDGFSSSAMESER